MKWKNDRKRTGFGWGAEEAWKCAAFVPIAPIACEDGLTLVDIREFDDELIKTVLGLLLSCWFWPKGGAAAGFCVNKWRNENL